MNLYRSLWCRSAYCHFISRETASEIWGIKESYITVPVSLDSKRGLPHTKILVLPARCLWYRIELRHGDKENRLVSLFLNNFRCGIRGKSGPSNILPLVLGPRVRRHPVLTNQLSACFHGHHFEQKASPCSGGGSPGACLPVGAGWLRGGVERSRCSGCGTETGPSRVRLSSVIRPSPAQLQELPQEKQFGMFGRPMPPSSGVSH